MSDEKVRKDLMITVKQIKGQCPVYSLGERFFIRDGFILDVPNHCRICMHSLASLMPYYVALSSGVLPESLGLSGTDSPGAFIQCLDPWETTGGGTVTFHVECLNDR